MGSAGPASEGRELVKSAAYSQLANRKVAITLLFLQIDARNAVKTGTGSSFSRHFGHDRSEMA